MCIYLCAYVRMCIYVCKSLFRSSQNEVFPDVSVLGNFLDNHDNPRFLHNNPDRVTLKNALAYVIFAEVSMTLC